MSEVDKDRELVAQTLKGRLDAFNGLMCRYQRLVYNIAFGCTQKQEDALDLTQTVFLKVFENLHSFRVDGNFKCWLARIAHNESLNWIRKHQRETLYEEIPEEASFGIPGQERELMNREIRERLHQGLGRLNPRYRLAITLRYFEGLTHRDIAEIQDCSLGMVKNTLFRALRQLQAFLLAQEIEKTAAAASRRGVS